MSTPIYILAGQSNGRRMADEVRDSLNARHGEGGYVLVQIAIAGARLTWANNDRDDWATASELPARLIAALSSVVTSVPNAHAAGMIWVQGESDTRVGNDADNYAERLRALIDLVQTELPKVGTPAARSFADMQVVVSQLAEASDEYFERVAWDTVIREQALLATQSDDVSVLDPDAVAREFGVGPAQMFADALHYTDAFNRLLADRLVTRLIEQNVPDSAAALPVFGSRSDDVLAGSSSGELIRGLGGEDSLSGMGGDDRILGGRDGDMIMGGSGADALWGYRGRDIIEGGDGDDRIFAGKGYDIARGGDGDDLIHGGGGRDNLHGGQGADQIFGGTWADRIDGGRGDDFLVGGAGADIIAGGEGHDLMIGGGAHMAGDRMADVFVFENTPSGAPEYDRIEDFEGGIDRLDVSAFGFASANQAYGRLVQTGYGVELHLATHHYVILEDVRLSELSAGDLIV